MGEMLLPDTINGSGLMAQTSTLPRAKWRAPALHRHASPRLPGGMTSYGVSTAPSEMGLNNPEGYCFVELNTSGLAKFTQ